MIRNYRSPEGEELGEHLARLCDQAEPEARLKVPELLPRCSSCALRAGRHIANGSPGTLLDVLKCVMERVPFYCHEPAREGELCSGWTMLMLTAKGESVKVPWPFYGRDEKGL
jgi:hypothetical protein